MCACTLYVRKNPSKNKIHFKNYKHMSTGIQKILFAMWNYTRNLTWWRPPLTWQIPIMLPPTLTNATTCAIIYTPQKSFLPHTHVYTHTHTISFFHTYSFSFTLSFTNTSQTSILIHEIPNMWAGTACILTLSLHRLREDTFNYY